MSRVLNIIVEGPTEREFVRNCLYPYIFSQGVPNVRTITIETSPGFKGGDISYERRFKPNIQKLLRGQEDLIVTSLIDFYRLRSDFPNYSECKKMQTAVQQVEQLENACLLDIGDARFIPYIQLHEFEGLLFTDKKGFESINGLSFSNQREILKIIEENDNPELINEGPTTAPSKRLQRLIPAYQKPLHGPFIILENGFEKILEKCPRFKAWTDHLIQKMKE